jgi:hypothetical protein
MENGVFRSTTSKGAGEGQAFRSTEDTQFTIAPGLGVD